MIELKPVPLNSENFAPFGNVIELEQAEQQSINRGLTIRFHDLFAIDAGGQGGRAIVSVFRTRPLPLPHRVRVMERHPLGSQAFLPVGFPNSAPFLVLVAAPKEQITADDLVLFMTNGRQGVNFHKNTWHHFQIVLGRQADFVVVDRGGGGNNLQEIEIRQPVVIPASVADTLARADGVAPDG